MNNLISAPVPAIETEVADFPELWRTLSRYKWHVLATTLLFCAIGTLLAFSEEPTYRATISVLIEARANRPVQIQDVYDPGIGTDDYYATQAELIRSRDLLGRVVDRLRLSDNKDVLPTEPPRSLATLAQRVLRFDWLPFLPDAEPAKAAADPPELRRERAVDVLYRSVLVSPVANTQVLRVSVDSRSPPLSSTIANTLGDLYVESGLEARLQATEHVSRWLTERLAEVSNKLQKSEQALQAYREKHKLVNVGGTRTLFEEDIIDNSRKLREAQRKKTELASTYWKIQQAGDDEAKLQEISTLLLDQPVQRASDNLQQAQQAVKQLQDRYGEKHPSMVAAQVKLAAAERAYHEQLRLAANGVKAEYEIASETERALTSVVEAGKQQIRTLDQQDYERRSLEREAQTNRDLYDMFLKRFKETDESSTYEPLNARVVDRATVPKVPAKPDKPRTILLWTLGGLVLGTLLAALRHLLSETIRSPEQLEHLTQVPVIAVLPRVTNFGRRFSPTKLYAETPRAAFPEGINSVRAALLLSDVDRRMKRIMVTSAMPQEGKSSLACGFALSLGQMSKTLLLEADLRAPEQKRLFGIAKEAPGLVEVLTGQVKVEDALYHHQPSGIAVLPVGKIPANPAEVISSNAFRKLIDVLLTRYERIIFDSPPCGAASDAILLSAQMDAVIFVIHGGKTNRRAVQAAIKHLRAAQAPLLGHVLNQVDARSTYGYGGQYYAYGQYGR
jgi:polysaccharide biosynthesis transport protein